MIRCGPNEIENETDMIVANSLTTWRSQRARRAICRKSAQTFHLPLVKYEDEYIFKAHTSKYRLKSSMGQTRDTNGIENWMVELFIDLLYGRDVELWLLRS